jgi:hypothetical protein
MLVRKYGDSYHTVDLAFDSKALNEISFRRNREQSWPAGEFEAAHRLDETFELVADAEGDVQDHTEQQLLDRLEAQIRELAAGLGEGQLLVIENEQGPGYPKTRQRTSNVLVEGENRLRFSYTIAPPLKVSRYTRGG